MTDNDFRERVEAARPTRETALMAAATLLQGKDYGSAEDLARTAIEVARHFEVYLDKGVPLPPGMRPGMPGH